MSFPGEESIGLFQNLKNASFFRQAEDTAFWTNFNIASISR